MSLAVSGLLIVFWFRKLAVDMLSDAWKSVKYDKKTWGFPMEIESEKRFDKIE